MAYLTLRITSNTVSWVEEKSEKLVSKRCSTGELAKCEFVGFYIRLEDVMTHVREITFYVYLFIFAQQIQGVSAEKYIWDPFASCNHALL
jgi:hypothetical protein